MSGRSDTRERRAHARLQFLADVQVEIRGVTRPARLRDLSFGGARVSLAAGVAFAGDSLRLEIPRSKGGGDGFLAEVVRVEPGTDSETIGLRFPLVDEEQRERLRETIRRFLQRDEGSEGGRRAFARLACRIDVRCESTTDLRGVLSDISRGGLSITTHEPIEVGQEVLLVLPDSAGEDLLDLRAVVTHSRESTSGPQATRVGMKFTPMSEERAWLLRALIERLGTGEPVA